MADPERELDAVIGEAERRLGDVDSGSFSPQPFHFLKLKVSEYVRSLVIESAKLSRRHRADVISAAHVEQASDYLVSRSSHRWFRHIGTVGGILLGASLSNFLAMTTAAQYSAIGVIISAALAVVGAFGVALHIGRG
jgi:hypothetical protein